MGDEVMDNINGMITIVDEEAEDKQEQHAPATLLWESPPKLQQCPTTTHHVAAPPPPPPPTTYTNSHSPLRQRRSTSSPIPKNGRHSKCPNSTIEKIAQEEQSQPHEQRQQQQQQSITTFDQEKDFSDDDNTSNINDTLLLQKFWRTYDTLIILSICSIIGIVFRMLSAKWFRLEMGSVFSEDSALGTNLPLNVWSCFLMGLLCSGRDAMGIVRSKVFGGANPYGTGRGILDVGKGAYRGVIDAGRAGIHRARGRVRVHGIGNDHLDSIKSSSQSVNVNNSSSRGRRGCLEKEGEIDDDIDDDDDTSASTEQPVPGTRHHGSEESIAGLLGLDDEFRIVGSETSSEEEIRDVQLRALSRRILASPSLAFFPAKKVENDVMEHYEVEAPSSPKSMAPDDRFEIGNVNDDIDDKSLDLAGGGASSLGAQNSSQLVTEPQHAPISNDGSDTERVHSISDHVNTLRRIHRLDGWDVDTTPEKMKHIILLGLRNGFCGALGTFASLNASVVRLLRAGLYGEALMGYAISIQLGIVSYRFGQHLAVYIFVWRCRRETKREERGGYGLRLRNIDTEEDTSRATLHPITQEPTRRRYISVRSCSTFIFIAMFVSLILAIVFFPVHRQYLISLLFTPFGCLARWKLMNKYNKSLPGFPLGTFACNISGCALSGSLASFIAGNPGADGGVVVTSMIAGFAGSLSTFSAFVVEILSLIDPIIFKFDGVVYSIITILWAVIIGFLVSQAKNWADEV